MPDNDYINLGHARVLLENVEQDVDQKDAKLNLQMRIMDAENDQELSDHRKDYNNPHKVTAQQTGADPAGTAWTAVKTHNEDPAAHTDIREAVEEVAENLDAVDRKADQLEQRIQDTDTANDNALSDHALDHSNPHKVTAAQVGADRAGTAASLVGAHDASTTAHADIRNTLSALLSQVDALDDSVDPSLNQMSEVVAYIKANRSMIAAFAGEVDETQAVQISLAVSAWKANADAVTVAAGLNYYADVAVTELTESDGTETILDVASLEAARACGMCATSVSLKGAVRYYARSIPASAITASVRIHKNIEE